MKILTAILSILLLASCTSDQCGATKDDFLGNYERFVDKVELKDLNSDSEAWLQLDQKFDQYINDCYTEFEQELTSSEQVDFATNTVKYYYTKYGHDIAQQWGINSEEFARTLTKSVEAFLHEHEGDIEALVKEYSSRIDQQKLEELSEKGSKYFQMLAEDLEK